MYYLKYQCWSQNIKTANFEKANFIKQNGVTKSESSDTEKSDNSLPISSKPKRTLLGSLISRLHNAILFYKVCSFKIHSFNVL